MAYKTAEDFVGTRTSAGFSLKDDHEDVYDEDIAGPNNDGIIGIAKLGTSGDRRREAIAVGGGSEYGTHLSGNRRKIEIRIE